MNTFIFHVIRCNYLYLKTLYQAALRFKIQSRCRYEGVFLTPSAEARHQIHRGLLLSRPGCGRGPGRPAACQLQAPPAGSEDTASVHSVRFGQSAPSCPLLTSVTLLGELTSSIRRVTGCCKGFTVEAQAPAQQRAQAFPVFLLQAVFPVGSPSLRLDG